MGKKFVFTCLLCVLQIISGFAFNLGNLEKPEALPILMDQCSAPPPDSFRIIGLGHNFVTVAWNPIVSGDSHLLSVFRQNSSNGWDTLNTIQVVNATSYTLTGIDHTKKHRIEIRTLCSNGEPGTASPAIIPPFTLILELVIGGRAPNSPHGLADCKTFINYETNNWVGFRLTKTVGNSTISSLFEFSKISVGESQGQIKRLCENNPLVAANDLEYWPTLLSGTVFTKDYTFKIGEVIQGIFNGFGTVEVNFVFPNLVSICTPPPSPPYGFQTLVSNTANDEPNCTGNPGGIKNQGLTTNKTELGQITVQNPVSDYLTLFFSGNSFESGLYGFTLMDINGKICSKVQMDVPEPIIAIPTGSYSPGLYILRVEFNGYTQNLKLIINR